jgi:hypothetical protein
MDGIVDLLDHLFVAPGGSTISESKLISHSRQLVARNLEKRGTPKNTEGHDTHTK